MAIAFANNQTLVAKNGPAITITTDPVSLEGYDRATGNFNVHSLWGTGSSTVTVSYRPQVSNDGTNWVYPDGYAQQDESAVTSPPAQDSGEVLGAFFRVEFSLLVTGATDDVGSATFDLHVLLDHS